MVWEPHVHFLVFEAWFTNAQSRLLGATNVYQMRLYVAHSQSFQLYQMTYVERQKFDEEEDEINLRSKLLRTLSKAASKGNFASAAMLDP